MNHPTRNARNDDISSYGIDLVLSEGSGINSGKVKDSTALNTMAYYNVNYWYIRNVIADEVIILLYSVLVYQTMMILRPEH